jgi:hypothetical protein
MHELAVAVGFLILVGLLVARIQRDCVHREEPCATGRGSQSPGSKRYPTQGSVMM